MRPIDILTSPWAIVPAKLREICEIYSTHLRGEKIDIEGLEARLGRPLAREEQGYTVQDGVAIIPIDGPIAKKMNLFMRVSGGASTQLAERDIRGALADPAVSAIVLQIDSPGGTVDGTQELARIVYEANEEKPLVAFSDGWMTSGAYWIGSAADGVYISGDTVLTGSIGVVGTHIDVSEYEKKIGIKTTEIYAGKYKRISSQYAPLSKEGRESLQEMVDYLYSVFVGDVAKFRGVSEEQVLRDMADGRIFIGAQGVTAGLVDGVSTLDALVADLSAGSYRRKRKAAAGSAAPATTPFTDAGAASHPQPTSQGDPMNREQLKKDHPELYQALLEEGNAQGRLEGALAERERIQAVEAQALPGHEKLVAQLKFDGKTTGAEAAVQVLAAEKAKNKAVLADLNADAPRAAPHAPAPAPEAALSGDENLPIDERCKAKWDKDSALRAEFLGNFESYLAFEKADSAGRVRILGKKAA